MTMVNKDIIVNETDQQIKDIPLVRENLYLIQNENTQKK